MKTSLPYYRQSAAAILTNFDSQTSGLSESEAKERRKHTELFTLPTTDSFGNLGAVLQRAIGLRFALLLLGATAAMYLGELGYAMLLFFIALIVGLLSGFYERIVWHGRTARNIRLPKQTKVVRANELQIISVDHLVPGDIVYFEAGDKVPADLRIVKSSKLLVSETIFTSSSAAITKDSRMLERFVARDKQSNMLFFGSLISQGTGYGVVTGLGKDTELGRLLWTAKRIPRRAVSDRIVRLQRALDFSVLTLVPIIITLALVNDWSAALSMSFISLALIATSLLDFYISSPFIAAGHAHMLGRHDYRTLQLASLETLGATTHIIADLRSAFVSTEPTVQSVHTGRQRHIVAAKVFSKQIQQELGMLPFVSQLLARLPNTVIFAQLLPYLPASTSYTYNYVASPELQNPSLHASTWQSDDHKDVLVIGGDLTALLTIATHINEHGHVRVMSAEDKERIARASTGSQATGTAYSYDTDAPNEIIFAGFIEAHYVPDTASYSAFKKLRADRINFTLVSDESAEQTNTLLRKIDLPEKDYTIIEHDDISKLSTHALSELLAVTTVVLSNVTGDDITKLAEAARTQGTVVVIGDRLELADTLSTADVVIARNSSLAADYAGVLMPGSTLAHARMVILQGQQTMSHLLQAQRVTPFVGFGLLALVWFTLGAQVLQTAPLLITPLGLTFVLIALCPLTISITWDKDPHSTHKTIQRMLTAPRSLHHTIVQIIALLTAIFGSFFVFLSLHNIHINGLAANGQTYYKATTISTITLALCLLIQIYLSRTATRRAKHSTALRSPIFWFAVVISSSLLIGLSYNEQLQIAFSTSSIFLKDWLIIAACVLAYGIIAALVHYDRHHTRSTIASQHNKTHI